MIEIIIEEYSRITKDNFINRSFDEITCKDIVVAIFIVFIVASLILSIAKSIVAIYYSLITILILMVSIFILDQPDNKLNSMKQYYQENTKIIDDILKDLGCNAKDKIDTLVEEFDKYISDYKNENKEKFEIRIKLLQILIIPIISFGIVELFKSTNVEPIEIFELCVYSAMIVLFAYFVFGGYSYIFNINSDLNKAIRIRNILKYMQIQGL